MSFFSKLKQALGFSDDNNDAIYNDNDDASPNLSVPFNHQTMGSDDSDRASDSHEEQLTFSDTIRRRIFDHVVNVFNGSMPVFIRDSVDPDAQSDYIYRTLDDSIKEYMAALEEQATRICQSRFSQKEEEFRAEIAKLQSQSKKINEDRSVIKERQLSADRQKRALNDKVHDLEQQVASLDAEREQLQLETKSLVNKLKVAQIQGGDPELQQEIDKLRTENSKLQDAVRKQSDMQKISDTMMGDLRQSAAKAREEANQLRSERDTAVKNQNALQTKFETTKRRLTEAEELIKEAADNQIKLDDIKATLKKKDQEIKALKDERQQLQLKIEELSPAPDAKSDKHDADISAPKSSAPVAEDPHKGSHDTHETTENVVTVSATTDPKADHAAQTAVAEYTVPDSTTIDMVSEVIPRITDESLDSIEVTFGEENWTTDTHQSAKNTVPKARQSNRRKHTPADDTQLTLF